MWTKYLTIILVSFVNGLSRDLSDWCNKTGIPNRPAMQRKLYLKSWNDCQKICKCPRFGEETCGSDGQTYPNICAMKLTRCTQKPKLKSVKRGPCTDSKPDRQMLNDFIPEVSGNISEEQENPEISEEGAVPDASENECDIACDRRFSPVCGSDGKTYPSECMMRFLTCKREVKPTKLHGGECKKSCPEMCPMIYWPVCGTDGVTYSNECEMGIASCKNGNLPITKLSDGACMSNDLSSSWEEVQEPMEEVTEPMEPIEETLKESTESCPRFCTRDGRRVCGVDGVTYPNECEMKRNSCKNGNITVSKSYDGPCISNDIEDVEEEESEPCPRFCTRILWPVCSSDGVTYSNECEMKRISCNNGKITNSKLYDGACRKKKGSIIAKLERQIKLKTAKRKQKRSKGKKSN